MIKCAGANANRTAEGSARDLQECCAARTRGDGGLGARESVLPELRHNDLRPSTGKRSCVDYLCSHCQTTFQLKSQSRAFSLRIVDAAYESMVRAIRENRTPALFALHYSVPKWEVENVIVIPDFAFPLSAIERRPPLSATARRAGWVGCNIRLDAIPDDAKIRVVVSGVPVSRGAVRRQYTRVKPLAKLDVEQRGWTLDVLNVVRSLGTDRFSLSDVYRHVGALSRLHPRNRHVRDKIRQQLQVLRDLGLLTFLGGGQYRIL
jgi:type II restriction enzyme